MTKTAYEKIKSDYVKVRFLAINSLHKIAEIIDQKLTKININKDVIIT